MSRKAMKKSAALLAVLTMLLVSVFGSVVPAAATEAAADSNLLNDTQKDVTTWSPWLEDVDPDNFVSADVLGMTDFMTMAEMNWDLSEADALNKSWYSWINDAGYTGQSFDVDTTVTHNDMPSIKYVSGNKDGEPSYNQSKAYFDVQLEPGTYTFSMWYKTQDFWGVENPDDSIRMELIFFDAAEKLETKFTDADGSLGKATASKVFENKGAANAADTDWAELTKEILIEGDEAQIVRFGIGVQTCGGTAWFSDFSITEKTEGGNGDDVPVTGDNMVWPIAAMAGVVSVGAIVAVRKLGAKKRG